VRGLDRNAARAASILAALVVAASSLATLAAQAPAAAAPRRSGQAAAPMDLTGTWVSVITEDWQWRMATPAKWDYRSVPLNLAGQKLMSEWEPGMETSCKAYGAAALLRQPGRIRISWENENTLKIETDAGVQTRRLRFGAPAAATEPRSLQGYSVAEWQLPGAGAVSEGAKGTTGSLKVVTTNMLAAWLRPNGVPYSEKAVMTEYFDRFNDGADQWFTVTTLVEDPEYLNMPFIISSNFKKEPDGSKWAPAACK
jgi:hypothetical protein